jgi:hypothetical protein
MRTSTGTMDPGSGADATTRTGTQSDVRPGTGTSAGAGTSPSERNGSASVSSSRANDVEPAGDTSTAAGLDHAESKSGSSGNSGTTSGSGTGNNTVAERPAKVQDPSDSFGRLRIDLDFQSTARFLPFIKLGPSGSNGRHPMLRGADLDNQCAPNARDQHRRL